MTRTVCSYCGVGCGIVVETERDAEGRRRVVKVSGDREHPANAGRLCTKGATSAEMAMAPGRLAGALVRGERGAGPVAVGVDEAIELTGRRLRAILDEHGPDAISFYVSGQMTLEAQYLANKLAKGFVGTKQIESNSRLCMASAGTGYKLSLGSDGPPGSYEDFDHADLFFVIGANMADCHPILFLRLMDRVKAGAKLIVVDPRRTATAAKADLFLPIRPGTDLALLNGLLYLLAEGGHLDQEFIAEHTEGWEGMPEFLRDYPPDTVAAVTGIPEADLRRAADMIAAAGEWMSCWTMGLNQSTHGTWNTNALCNLHLATGAICRPGSGPFSLTGQPNAMGGREMGYMGPGLPGQRSVVVAEDRRFAEELWGLPPGTLRAEVGAGTVDMFARMAAGEIKACWVICTNPVASVGNRRTVIAGLEAAEFVVTQDVFAATETNAYADVVLPATMWAESEGVMINSERNLTLLQQAADPPGDALPDWQLIARVASAMGYADAFTYSSAEEIFEEIKQAWNPKTGYDLRGVTYERLRETPVQWPAAPDSGARNPVRYRNDGISQTLLTRPDGTRPRLAFATPSGRAVFYPRPHLPPAELPDDAYPYVLNTGRLQHQWHTLTKTGKVAKLNKLNPGPFVEIHPDDAAGHQITDGDLVAVESRRGRAVLPAVLTDRVLPGTCFAPFHWNDLFGEYLSVNAVTSDAVDPLSFQPELKVCAVSLTKVPAELAPGSVAGSGFGSVPGPGVASGNGGASAPRSVAGSALGSTGPGVGPGNGSGAASAPGSAAESVLGSMAGAEAGLGSGNGAVSVPRSVSGLGSVTGSGVGSGNGSGAALGSMAGPGAGSVGEKGSVAGAVNGAAIGSVAERIAGQMAVAAELLGVSGLTPPQLSEDEQFYLAGFLTGLSRGGGEGTPVLPAHAPVDPGHALWINGLLAGMFAREPVPSPSSTQPAAPSSALSSALSEAPAPGRELLVLWASQTGTAEEFATASAQRLAASGYAARLVGMDGPVTLPPGADVLVISSTFGDGEPPDNGTGFWEALAHPDAVQLDGVRYAVLAFGDSSYANFCGHGRRLDQRLAELGGRRIVPRMDCEPDDGRRAQDWLDAVITALAEPPPSRDAPLPAPLLGNRLLSLPGSAKEVREFVVGTEGRLTYQAGDSLGVVPVNSDTLVAEWLAVTGLNSATIVELPERGPVSLGEALARHLDITKITPALLRFAAERTKDRDLIRLLRPGNEGELAKWTWGRQAVDVAADLRVRATAQEWAGVFPRLQPRRYSIASSPLVHPDEIRLVVSVVRFDNPKGVLRRGACSAYLADGGVGGGAGGRVVGGTDGGAGGRVVRGTDGEVGSGAGGRVVGGTGGGPVEGPEGWVSGGADGRVAGGAAPIPVYVQPTPHFRPPVDPDTRMIMIGPGTGVAPFLGFLDERRALGHRGANWLFFGEQRRATDFYFGDHLTALHEDGFLTRLDLAFSRDQRSKIYVQDRMREHGAQLWAWLESGACLYVCGDATRMAKDVDRTLREIVTTHGGLTTEDATAYVKQLTTTRRYLRDVY
ncbi:bifunctional nitrate reductase/sulfite reductase flavoprotein subunit alpha [Acrocarpospora catenulata]|uniref:bifunctional nitrate reductase/sulfite reductase flavoprotein subunit alpha n=1 Tax=Acrocarpospora catenulata TaxID=2836182 RepID=UPI0027E1E417|nr:bifunctional nitrate reductase/sulfite reductase flavoprotein subunit alpha [Acrocarpospora catenulata]